jgi:hypothetical protein
MRWSARLLRRRGGMNKKLWAVYAALAVAAAAAITAAAPAASGAGQQQQPAAPSPPPSPAPPSPPPPADAKARGGALLALVASTIDRRKEKIFDTQPIYGRALNGSNSSECGSPIPGLVTQGVGWGGLTWHWLGGCRARAGSGAAAAAGGLAPAGRLASGGAGDGGGTCGAREAASRLRTGSNAHRQCWVLLEANIECWKRDYAAQWLAQGSGAHLGECGCGVLALWILISNKCGGGGGGALHSP